MPTHKLLTTNLSTFLKESDFAYREYNLEIPILVYDNGSYFEENKSYIQRLNAQFSNRLNIRIITKSDLKAVLFEHFSNQYKRCLEIIFSTDFGFGNLNNQLSLISSIFAPDGYHRRDDDTTLISINGTNILPIESELKTIFEIDPELRFNGGIVGGSYSGKQDTDFYNIFNLNHNIGRELFRLVLNLEPEISEELVNSFFHKFQISMNIHTDNNVLKVNRNSLFYPECGNCFISQIHRRIPAIPSEMGIGEDSLLHYLLIKSEGKIYYHHKPIYHFFTSSPNSIFEDLRQIWFRQAQFMDATFLKNKYLGKIKDITTSSIKSSTVNLIRNFNTDRAERISKMNELVNMLGRIDSSNYRHTKKYLSENINKIIDMNEKGLINYQVLLNDWENLNTDIISKSVVIKTILDQ
jgi:hypothetical protein